VFPGGRDRQRANARERLGVANDSAVWTAVGECTAGLSAEDAGLVVADVAKLRLLGGGFGIERWANLRAALGVGTADSFGGDGSGRHRAPGFVRRRSHARRLPRMQAPCRRP